MAWRGSPAAGMFRGQPCIATGRHRLCPNAGLAPWVLATTPPCWSTSGRRIAESRFTGEGYRKIWARVRFSGVRSVPGRVRRLMRENHLLAPHRLRKRPDRVHDGTITTEAVDVLWGTDMTQSVTLAEGVAHVFVAVDHCNSECVGIHADKSANRFQALEPVRQGVRRHFGAIGKDVAAGLML